MKKSHVMQQVLDESIILLLLLLLLYNYLEICFIYKN